MTTESTRDAPRWLPWAVVCFVALCLAAPSVTQPRQEAKKDTPKADKGAPAATTR